MEEGIYLDNAATSWPKPEEVCLAVEHYMRASGGTPARGRHPKSLEAGRLLEECRKRLFRMLGGGPGYRLAFTSGATESLNLALKGWLPGRSHAVVTDLEHNSVFRPLSALARDRGVTWTVVPANRDGTVDPAAVGRAIRPETRLVAVSHASNVLGTRVDVGAVAEVAHRKGVPLLVDAAQTVGVIPVDCAADSIDMLAFTGHKSLLGPSGTGGLLFREDLGLAPLKEGGTGTFGEVPEQPAGFPERYESGSPNMVGIAGLAAGISFLERTGVAAVGQKKARQVAFLREALEEIEGVTLYGSDRPERSVGILSFNVRALPSDRVAELLWDRGRIMVRAGFHCAPFIHAALETRGRGAVRVGVGFSTPEAYLRALVDTVRSVARDA